MAALAKKMAGPSSMPNEKISFKYVAVYQHMGTFHWCREYLATSVIKMSIYRQKLHSSVC